MTKKNYRGKTKPENSSPPTTPPSKSKHIPPLPTQCYQYLDSDDQPGSSDNPDRINPDGIDAMSPPLPPLTSDSPTPGLHQSVLPTDTNTLFSPVTPREESQSTPPSPQVNGKRKRTESSQDDPAHQTPSRSHSNRPSPLSSRGEPAQRNSNTLSTLPKAITFNHPHFPPSQHSSPDLDALMDQDGVNPNRDVTGFFGNNPLVDLRSEMKSGWKNLEMPKALAIPYRATYSDQHKFQTVRKLENAISHALGGAQPTILAPEKAESTVSTTSTYRPPWCYLVTNLPAHDIELLTEMGFISNEYCGVQILPFTPLHTNYVASIRGLVWKKSTDSKAVEALIRSTLESSGTKQFILNFIADKNDRIPTDLIGRDLAFEWIINSVRAYIHILGEEDPTTTETLWRWYINTPSAVDTNVILWTNHFKTVSFNGVIHGWGNPYIIDRCTGCKSTNHPTSDCPFPKRFPQLDDTNPAPSRSSTRGRGKPSKDRGRGGGGRGRGGPSRNTTVAT